MGDAKPPDGSNGGDMNLYLDCYFHGAMLGDQFPVNTYGPAPLGELIALEALMSHNFDRTIITSETKGQNPLPPHLWPGVERPR